ncbi:hypothetical protein ACFVJK_24820 [Streptomyces sp. NPDC127172]|jgi:hypothetical protein|uniref:hypothetical protein n=1 Tax=Streptomyces sp. NPDC127172 TaxID=3345382 RepID=UPI003645AFAB
MCRPPTPSGEYSDTAGIPVEKDPSFPVRLSGWARAADGTVLRSAFARCVLEERGAVRSSVA